MGATKISLLTTKGTPAGSDYIPLLDISDPSIPVTKKAFVSSLLAGGIGARVLVVLPSAKEVAGKIYLTVVAAIAYAVAQSPGLGTEWTIYVYGTNSETFNIPAWVRIVGDYNTKFTGAWTVSNTTDLLAGIYNCYLTNFAGLTGGTGVVYLDHCVINSDSPNCAQMIMNNCNVVYALSVGNSTILRVIHSQTKALQAVGSATLTLKQSIVVGNLTMGAGTTLEKYNTQVTGQMLIDNGVTCVYGDAEKALKAVQIIMTGN